VNADRIYTMDDGQIRECGQHEQLIRDNGIYANLYTT